MHRDAQVTIIFGRNGTGKSTFCKEMIDRIGKRALVVTYNGQPKIWRSFKKVDIRDQKAMNFKKGIRQVIAYRYEESPKKNKIFEYLYKNYRDGIIVWDDCRGYIDSSVDRNPYFRRLLNDFRHRMLDHIFVVHSPTDVPVKMWNNISDVFVGATDAMVNKSQVKTHSADRIIEMQHQVNEAFRIAKEKEDDSHYGLFKRISV